MPKNSQNYSNSSYMIHLGRRLRELRTHHGLTQREVPQQLGLERSTYAYYECGKSQPDLLALLHLSQITA